MLPIAAKKNEKTSKPPPPRIPYPPCTKSWIHSGNLQSIYSSFKIIIMSTGRLHDSDW